MSRGKAITPQNNTPSNSTASENTATETKRKVVISFVSYDQDSWDVKSVDQSFMSSFKKRPEDRHDIWRPSVALASLTNLEDTKNYKPLKFDDYYLLWDEKPNHKKITDEVKEDIEQIENRPNIHLENPGINYPFDTNDVYKKLYTYLQKDEFHQPNTEYFVNCTNGTTQIRNCLFLLTQIGHINALRISPTPWINHRQRGNPQDLKNGYLKDGHRSVTGSYTLEDPKQFGAAYAAIRKTEQKGTCSILSHNFTMQDKTPIDKIAAVVDAIKRIPDDDYRKKQSILITGETGVGKTQLAENIAKVFNANKFVPLNCATIRGADPNIQRMELFGADKGAASNVEPKEGALKKADGGVLFLDEIGELSLEMQAMLLTALDKGEFIPLGGNPAKPIKSNFQLVCGTNRPMEELVESGHFRRDLYNRINTWHFSIPPLRERRMDIELMVTPDYIHNKIGKPCGINNLTFNDEAKKIFLDFSKEDNITWDGNFRELNAMLNRMAILSNQLSITKEIVEEEIKQARNRYNQKAARRHEAHNPLSTETPPPATVTQPEKSSRVPPSTPTPTAAPVLNRGREFLGDELYLTLSPLDRQELEFIIQIIDQEKPYTLKDLSEKLFGNFTPGRLERHLKKKFNLKFSHGDLTRLKT